MQIYSVSKEKTKANGMSTEKVKVQSLLTCHQKLPPSDGNAPYVFDVTTQKITATVPMRKANGLQAKVSLQAKAKEKGMPILRGNPKESIKPNPTARNHLQNHHNGSKDTSETLCLNITSLTRMDAFMTPIVARTDSFAK